MTNFGHDPLWPRPTLATTHFGHDQLWPRPAWQNRLCHSQANFDHPLWLGRFLVASPQDRRTALRRTAQNFALLSFSRPHFHSFFLFLWGSSRGVFLVACRPRGGLPHDNPRVKTSTYEDRRSHLADAISCSRSSLLVREVSIG